MAERVLKIDYARWLKNEIDRGGYTFSGELIAQYVISAAVNMLIIRYPEGVPLEKAKSVFGAIREMIDEVEHAIEIMPADAIEER